MAKLRSWLLKIRDAVRVNFWLIPSAMVLSAVALSSFMVQLDAAYDGQAFLSRMGWKFTSGTDGARQVLATIASSMITITSITFSVTIVALQLASSQFGPRLLRNFMADRGTQIVLGTFIATFTYSLLVLRSVHTEDDERFVPHLALLVAVAFALAALGVLIFFIHHTAKAIQADYVIKNVSRELRTALETLFPEPLGKAARAPQDVGQSRRQLSEFENTDNAVPIVSSNSNYLQAVDTERLMELAAKYDLMLRLDQRPGRFLLEGIVLAYAWPAEKIHAKLYKEIRGTFLLGSVRSPLQDAEFAVDQLVEIAVRALSKGINDPYTAITCVDRLAEALKVLSSRAEPAKYRADESGKLRIVSDIESFAGIAEACFDQIRQAARDVPAVLIRILDRIIDVAPSVNNVGLQAALAQQVTMIGHTSRHGMQSGKDLQDIERRCHRATRLLS